MKNTPASKYLPLLLAAFAIFANSAAIAETRLFGDADGTTVRLVWSLTEWPDNTIGFAVKKRQSNGPWTAVTTVYPEISAATDWTSREPDVTRHSSLIDKLNLFVAQGAPTHDRDAFIQQFQAQPDILAALSRESNKDFDVALISGIGAVDRLATPPAGTWEYGIFAVADDAGNTADTDPAATVSVRPATDPLFNWDLELTAEGNQSKAALSWNLDKTLAQTWGVLGFIVQEQTVPGTYTDLVLNPVCDPLLKPAGDSCLWTVNGAAGETRTYRVIPKSFFGRDLATATVVYNFQNQTAYVPQNPGNLTATPTETGVALTWEFPEADRPNVTGYQVQRSSLDNAEFADVSPVIETDVLTFTDAAIPAAGGTFMYQIVARDAQYGDRLSNTAMVLMNDPSVPSAPTDLTATLLPPATCYGEEDEPTSGFWCQGAWKLQLDWQAPATTPAEIAGYQLYADLFKVDAVTRLNSAPLADTTHTETMGQSCRPFTWRVAAITASGIESEPLETTLFVPMGKLPDVQLATFIVTREDDNSKIEWEYDAIPDLAGFRLYQHNVDAPILLADETTITSDLREIVIETPEPQNGTVYYKLQAVSKYAGIRTELTAPKKLE